MLQQLYRPTTREFRKIGVDSIRALSSSSMSMSGSAGNVNAITSIKTAEQNPANLSTSHLGRFYSIKDDVFKQLFNCLPGWTGIPPEFSENCKTFRENCFLVRKCFLDIKNCIESYDSRLPTMRYIIYGIPGAGKTLTMANIIHYGYTKEYVLLHVPWVPLFTRFSKESLGSTIRPDFYDHTTNAVFWLGHFRSQNLDILTKLDLKTEKEYTWSPRESTPVGTTLLDLANHGIARPVYASETVYSIVEQVKYHANAGRCKTLVCIDGVNGMFYTPREVWRDDKSFVPHTHITFFEAFKQTFKDDWSGGVVVGTVDKLALPAEYRESDFPRYLLNKEGWEAFDPFVPIQVDIYTSQEVQTTLEYYLERKWLQHPNAGTPQARQEMEYLSTRNPLTLMQLAAVR